MTDHSINGQQHFHCLNTKLTQELTVRHQTVKDIEERTSWRMSWVRVLVKPKVTHSISVEPTKNEPYGVIELGIEHGLWVEAKLAQLSWLRMMHCQQRKWNSGQVYAHREASPFLHCLRPDHSTCLYLRSA